MTIRDLLIECKMLVTLPSVALRSEVPSVQRAAVEQAAVEQTMVLSLIPS